MVFDCVGRAQRGHGNHRYPVRDVWRSSSPDNSNNPNDLRRQHLRIGLWCFVGEWPCKTFSAGWHCVGYLDRMPFHPRHLGKDFDRRILEVVGFCRPDHCGDGPRVLTVIGKAGSPLWVDQDCRLFCGVLSGTSVHLHHLLHAQGRYTHSNHRRDVNNCCGTYDSYSRVSSPESWRPKRIVAGDEISFASDARNH